MESYKPFRASLSGLLILALVLPRPLRAESKQRVAPDTEPAVTKKATDPNLALLTPEEREILWIGEIDQGERIGGGIAALLLGFGVGHAIQGRYSSDGYLFTILEGAAVAVGGISVLVVTITSSNDLGGSLSAYFNSWIVLFATLGALGGIRIWQTLDAFIAPGGHNERYREIKARQDRKSSQHLRFRVMPGTIVDNDERGVLFTPKGVTIGLHF